MSNVWFKPLAPLRNNNEVNYWENKPFIAVWPENVVQNTEITSTINNKEKRTRTIFSTDQLRALEMAYSRQRFPYPETLAQLTKTLNISHNRIKVWFQNRRRREKISSISIESPPSPDSTSSGVTTANQIVKFSHYTDNSYQLPTSSSSSNQSIDVHYRTKAFIPLRGIATPTCYNTSPVQSSYRTVTPPDFATYFINDNNVYPNEYYP